MVWRQRQRSHECAVCAFTGLLTGTQDAVRDPPHSSDAARQMCIWWTRAHLCVPDARLNSRITVVDSKRGRAIHLKQPGVQ
jgi:hypothetical protein